MIFECQRCRATLKVPEGSAGKKITCPKCRRRIEVPESLSLDDEPPAEPVKGRRRRVPRWAWAAGAMMFLTLVAVGVVAVVVRYGPKDGLTRAERAELETKMKRDLPGVWEHEGRLGRKTLYTFTTEGRYDAVRYEDGKKAGGHVGTWSVSGSRMTLQVTESADDLVKTGKPLEMAITDIKSENGAVFKFTISQSDPFDEARTLTLTKRDEHPAWLVGQWATEPPDDVRMDFRFEAGGRFTQSLKADGTPVSWSSGDWSVDGDKLILMTRETNEGVSLRLKPNTFSVHKAPNGKRFTLVSENRKIEMTFARTR